MTRAPLFALLLFACDAGTTPASPPPPVRPIGELTMTFGSSPDDTLVVHPDGSFAIVIPEFKDHLASCATGPDGICPRHVDACTVTGDSIAHCPQVELKKAADGTVDVLRLLDVTIASDGAVVYDHARFVIAASGLVLPELAQHLPTVFLPPPFGDFKITGATTPELRRRAMLVMLVAVVTRMTIPGIRFPD